MTTKNPMTLAAAVALVQGKADPKPEPSTLADALAVVRSAKRATEAPKPPKAAVAPTLSKEEPLPGLRAHLEERRRRGK